MINLPQRAQNTLLIRKTENNITSIISRCDVALPKLNENPSLSHCFRKMVCRTLISDVSILRDTIENVLHDQASNNKPFAVGNCAYVKKRLRNSEQIPEEYEDSVLKCDVKHKDGYNLRESPRLVEML